MSRRRTPIPPLRARHRPPRPGVPGPRCGWIRPAAPTSPSAAPCAASTTARRAADGLKDGQQQIVNLEQTPVEMAERIIDFLNGATYALDGSVEKIGEQVYLFTPASVIIDVEEKPTGNSRVSFIDTITP